MNGRRGGKNNEPGEGSLAGLFVKRSYFLWRMASFAAFAMRNLTTVFAGI